MQYNEIEIRPEDVEVIRSVDSDRWLRMYRKMLQIRYFEEQVNELHARRRLFGPVHLYAGQEALAVGTCEVLRDTDYVTSHHRGHGHCLAKGGSVDRMFAEILGKANGYCGGKGGSMHIADPDTGNLGANGIVGGSVAIAAGAALSAQVLGTNHVTVCFFGDGALGQGLLYEAMNMAALWKLPVLYVCENNLYGEFSHYHETTAGNITDRAAAFGIHAEDVDGQNVCQVYAVVNRLIQRARKGEGPAFLLGHTYRFYGHYTGDADRPYRSRAEEDFWKSNRDPLKIFESWVTEKGTIDVTQLQQTRQEVLEEVQADLRSALEAPTPDASEVDRHVFA